MNKTIIKKTHDELIVSDIRLKRNFSEEELKVSFKERRKKNKIKIDDSVKIDESNFKDYMPLATDMRLNNKIALLSTFFLNLRRIVSLYLAMFIVG